MADIILIISTLAISLWAWGILRSAVWLLPAAVFPPVAPLIASSILAFYLIMTLSTAHKGGAWDFRHFDRQRFSVVFFCAGLIVGTVFYPSPLFVFALGAFIPFVILRLFIIVRHPAPLIVFINKKFRLAVIGAWILVVALKFWEQAAQT